MKYLIPLALITLAACDPAQLADDAMRRAASTVVMPVVSRDLPSGPAQLATNCILDAADPAEIRALARDVGVSAGSLTRENIRTLALRPKAEACFAAHGVPPVR
jgi:hypothetical protein